MEQIENTSGQNTKEENSPVPNMEVDPRNKEMKDIKTRTERLSDERHSPVFQQQFGGELGQHGLKQSDHFHHKRLKGSITVG